MFILLFQSDDWEQHCETLIEDFDSHVRHIYDYAGREAGGIQAEDRHGVTRFFSFTSLSIGAVRVRRGQFCTAELVATAAASAKHGAKQSGVGLFVRQGESMFAALGDY